jgi:outer membrane protein assembly factor BamB
MLLGQSFDSDLTIALSADDGEEQWSIQSKVAHTPDSGYNTIEVEDGMVVVDVNGTAEAFSSSDGEVLWSYDADDTISLGVAANDKVYVSDGDFRGRRVRPDLRLRGSRRDLHHGRGCS